MDILAGTALLLNNELDDPRIGVRLFPLTEFFFSSAQSGSEA